MDGETATREVALLTSALWDRTMCRTIFAFVPKRRRGGATSRKVAGSIPDGVTGIFHRHNPSGRTMALGLTQPRREMNARNISWGIKGAVA
jgi:hypothetical protein